MNPKINVALQTVRYYMQFIRLVRQTIQ